jgi:hypothetical protein
MSKHYKVKLKDEDIIIQCPNDEEAAQLALTLSIHLEQDLIDVIPMKRQRKYFPNEWKKWKDRPAEAYVSLPFDLFYEMRVRSYMLDEETYCVFRLKHIKTGRITERAYKSKKHALSFLENTCINGVHQITMVTDDDIKHYDPLMQAVDLDELF